MKTSLIYFAILFALSVNVLAQGVREPAKSSASAVKTTGTTADGVQTTNATSLPKPQPAPQTFAAQYQGGLFGYNKKLKGTLTYDDVNKRFVFRNEQNKEIFGLPYKSLMVVYGSSKSVRPTAAKIASAVPSIYAVPFGFIRGKNRYLIIEFNDPDSDVQGTASFKIANKELLQSVIQSLGDKAELKQRGDAFYRPRDAGKPVL